MRDGIDWAEVGSGGRFEQIVSVLLSTLFPESRRIDGAGGDGGRDHQFSTPDRLDLWQSKYFLRRLSEAGGRKTQITNSLNAAAALQPDTWSLVTPMIPSPEELRWFESLQPGYPFPLTWRSGDWLEAQLKDHPSIIRHFMGANDHYVALLRELDREQDILVDGVPAAVERIEQLADKINAANPFYRADFVVHDGKVVSTSLAPKYAGANEDSPISVQLNVIAGPETDGSHIFADLESALDWGDEIVLGPSQIGSLVIEAPHGQGGTFQQPTVRIGPASKENIDLQVRLTLHSPDKRRLAVLPIRMTERIAAPKGITLHGRDLTGTVKVRLRADPAERTVSCNLNFDTLPPLLPGAVLPAMRFLNLATAPNTMSLGLGDSADNATMALPAGKLIADDLVRVVESLERVQAVAGEPFPIPEALSPEDQVELRKAIRLIEGHRVKIGEGTLTFGLQDSSDASSFGQPGMFSLAYAATDPYIARIAGHELDLGPCTYYVQRARLAAGQQPDSDGQYTVVPEPGFGIEIALGELSHGAGLDPADPA